MSMQTITLIGAALLFIVSVAISIPIIRTLNFRRRMTRRAEFWDGLDTRDFDRRHGNDD